MKFAELSLPALDLPRQARSHPIAATDGADQRATMLELAQEFEAMFLLQMLKQMRQSMFDDEAEGEFGSGTDTMTDVVDLELSRHLSRTGGLGLAEKLAETLQRQYAMPEAASPTVEPPAAAFSPTAPAPPAPRPVAEPVKVAPAGALPLPLDAPVTSRFGWRTDPFDGTRRFHRGVDIGAAYGTEVPSAAPGRVEFVGEQGGYGSTVVIAHDDGLRSRYAHLSATSVEVGDRVQSGDVVGRVGRSGRATGAHLHFEIADGRTDLNPIALAKRHAALKVLQPQVDSSIDRAHALSVGTGEDHEN